MNATLLPRDAFLAVVRDTPLVAIDLVIQDENDQYLFGLRRNLPARDFWFVPGGRILKDETLDQAFVRLCAVEIGYETQRASATFLGVYEHFYAENALAEPGFGTHYVVLGHKLYVNRCDLQLPMDQHDDYRWLSLDEALRDASIHAYSRAYLEFLQNGG